MFNFRNLIGVITLFSVIAFGFTSTDPVKTSYTIDAQSSKIEWHGEKVTGSHYGNINLQEGNFDFVDGALTGGSFVVDMTSITNLDIEDETYNQKLVGHLKSDDFFGVETYPTSSFKITKAIPYGTDGNYKIVGDLTIKGITKEVKFNATVKPEGDQVSARAEVVIDRSEFNVRYGSGSFFDDLGDKTIYDEFTLKLDFLGKAAS